jgi:hypothetical protein
MSKTNRSKSNRGTALLVRGKHREHWCSTGTKKEIIMSSQQVMPNRKVTEEVTMAQDARPSGASVKQHVFGDQMKKAPPDPFLGYLA